MRGQVPIFPAAQTGKAIEFCVCIEDMFVATV